MPVRKFRSIEEMKCELWYEPGTPELWRAIAETWSFAASANRLRFPPGVHKFRSIEDAERWRDEWTARSLAEPGK